MQEYCARDTSCNPCAYSLSYLVAKYETHVEMAIESIFSEISENTALILKKAKDDASGKDSSEVLVRAQSMQIKMPV